MDFVTVRELRDKSGEIWQRVEAGEEFVVTRNGKPFALLVHTEPAAVEAKLRALRLHAFSQAWNDLASQARAGGAADLSDDEIHAEIDAVRRKRRGAATVLTAAEPTPPRLTARTGKAATAKRRSSNARGR